jgi:hypothetical protein
MAARFGPMLSAMFLHGGLLHLVGNMWTLWIFGDNVEDRLGRGRYLVYYVACGLAAAYFHYWMDPLSDVPAIGASGAIAGVMGGYFVPAVAVSLGARIGPLHRLVRWQSLDEPEARQVIVQHGSSSIRRRPHRPPRHIGCTARVRRQGPLPG